MRNMLLSILSLLTILNVFGVTSGAESGAIAGQIAFVGNDRNMYAVDLTNNDLTVLTSDASVRRSYGWPTWSNDGRLTFIRASLTDNGNITDVMSSRFPSSPRVIFTTRTENFTYMYWSPEGCDEGDDCRDLAVLMSNPNDGLFSLHLVRQVELSNLGNLAGRGSPFYFSWSPDGTHLLWQRDSQRIDVYDVGKRTVDNLSLGVGLFSSPAWSPVDDRWLVGTQSNGTLTDISLISQSTQQVLVPKLDGPVVFNWSPDGNHIAYVDGNGPLTVINSITGLVESRSPMSGVYAFFWSPDSQSVAYITLGNVSGSISAGTSGKLAALYQNQGFPTIEWSVISIDTGENRRYVSFVPTPEMTYFLRFFDQFSQSHRVWSPDSRYLVYSEQVLTSSRVSVLDTTSAEVVPFSVADGVFGVWSFN